MTTEENPTHKWLTQKRMSWQIKLIESNQNKTRFDYTYDLDLFQKQKDANIKVSEQYMKEHIKLYIQNQKAEKNIKKADMHLNLWPDYLRSDLEERQKIESSEEDQIAEAKLEFKINLRRQVVNIVQNEHLARTFRIKERFMKIMHKDLRDQE